jgi:hypothetical protein
MLNRMIAIGFTVIRQAVWICNFTAHRSTEQYMESACFLQIKCKSFLQDLPAGRVLPAEIETKTMKLMTTIQPGTNFRPGAQPTGAADRVEICRPATLAEAVDAAVMGVERPLFKPAGPEVPGLAFQPRVMLAVLTYCYARQILSSSEVWSNLMRDAAFRKICQNTVPGPDRIRHFRDENREALHECLTMALLFVARQKVSAETVARAGESEISMEARRRIILAACLDNLEMEAGGWPCMLDQTPPPGY